MKSQVEIIYIVKAFSIIKHIKLVEKEKFAAAALDLDNMTFIIHIAFLADFHLGLEIYPFYRAQIVSLNIYKALISVFSKYTDFTDVFFKDLTAKLLKHNEINNHTINLVKGQ